MPKTAAAVLGFALVTGSIGLNTTRYPVVWKMVGAADPAVPTGETIPSAVVPGPSSSDRPAPAALEKPPPTLGAEGEPEAAPERPALEKGVDDKDADDNGAVQEKAAADASMPAADGAGPAEAANPSPEKKTPETSASESTAKTPADTTSTTMPPTTTSATPPIGPTTAAPSDSVEETRKPLVPVLPAASIQGTGGSSGVAAEVRRLPPVEQSSSLHGDGNLSRLFVGTIPAYPTTKIP